MRRIQSSSEGNEFNSSSDEENSENTKFQGLKKRYEELLKKFENGRRRKTKVKPPNRRDSSRESNSSKSLAERIRGWQVMELERHDDYKEQYHAWLSFKSCVEANWKMYNVTKDSHKLTCLQTKCKGFVLELVNSIQRGKPTFAEVWNGLQTQFYAPINSGEETSVFYQTKQQPNENIFNFFERVTKQAYLCDFEESELPRRIGETVSRNCLNPSFFLGKFDKFDDLDKLKNHGKNFHAALPKYKQEPVLAVKHQQFPREMKRKNEGGYDFAGKRNRFESNKRGNYSVFQQCKYCGGEACNRRNCPARGRKCNYCQRFDHFEKACLKKKFDNQNANVNAVQDDDKVGDN